MSKASQEQRTNQSKARFQKIWIRRLTPWMNKIVADYSIGSRNMSPERIREYREILNTTMTEECNAVYGFKIQEYKQEDEELLEGIRRVLAGLTNNEISVREVFSMTSVANTTGEFMARTMEAVEAGSPLSVYQKTLRNYLYNHRLIIAVQETNFTEEFARKASVATVKDPLGNSVSRIAALIEEGDVASARKLNRQVQKLVNLTLSDTQLTAINRLQTPLIQGQAVTAIREDAARVGAQVKKWQALFSNTRATHESASGQERGLEQPFSVGDSLMQYPQDGSLGASGSEIFGCQCWTYYP